VKKQKVLLLGATGSIGRQTLEFLAAYPEKFTVCAVAAYGHDPQGLEVIIQTFAPDALQIHDGAVAKIFRKNFARKKVFSGEHGLRQLLETTEYDIAVNALPGITGLMPSKKIIAAGKKIILANKESLVSAGEKLLSLAKKTGAEIFPLDSELSALQNLLHDKPLSSVHKVYLTASGGPFHDAALWSREKLACVTPTEALAHPTWKMGPKITIDSATLMNKAFEMIALVKFFHIPPKKVSVVIHPQSFLHAAVEFTDGQITAEMSAPDMRTWIARAFGVVEKNAPATNIFAESWTFFAPDEARFPSLKFARVALKRGQKACADLCRANDILVAQFLSGKISFGDIFSGLAKSLSIVEAEKIPLEKNADFERLAAYISVFQKGNLFSPERVL